MPVYVDDAAIVYRGKPRYHLTATDLGELHAFAHRVGIKRCWYHRASRYPHYDITATQREAALAGGALAVTSKELVPICKALRQTLLGAPGTLGSPRTRR